MAQSLFRLERLRLEFAGQAGQGLEVAAEDVEAYFLEPVWSGDERVGFVTSAAYGHTCDKSLALGYVAMGTAAPGTALEVTILGERRACRVLGEAAVDPAGARMRA